MKAFQIQKSFGIDSLTVVERLQPRPSSNQILVKLHAASLNYRDLLVVKGIYDPKMTLPRVPLSDAAGEVVEIGSSVSRFKIGDRVAGTFMQEWADGELTPDKARSALGGAIDGLLMEYAVLNEDGAVFIPEHLSYDEAATLPCAAVTAWHALITEGNLTAGDTVLVQGTGGVSLFALQFAGMIGARVIITSSSDEKLRRAQALGAAEVINYKQTPDWEKRVVELTDGAGCDHVVEVGGAGTLPKSLSAVRIGGRISLIGVLTGGSGEVNPMPVLMKAVRMQGIYVGSRQMFERMNKAIALHKMRPCIDRTFPFVEAPAALRHMESGAHFGKIVVRFE